MAITDPGDVKSILAAVKARLEVIQAQWKALDDERNALMQVQRHYAGGGVMRAPNTAPNAGPAFSRMGPTEALREYLSIHSGFTPSQVLDALEPVVVSKSADIRKTLSWTIGDLVKRGEVERRNGKLYIASEESAIEDA
jgi:hypothetical protein